MMFLKRLLGYLNPMGFLTKAVEGRKNVNLRFMHGINRISIWMMLFAVVVMVLRYFIL
ncbi:MAG: hypothetical protein NTW54_11815 [Bacteroidetes bacterium]|nr:hypothetical protein [Bacteroidota bacterium]